jgi:hypothetical protein
MMLRITLGVSAVGNRRQLKTIALSWTCLKPIRMMTSRGTVSLNLMKKTTVPIEALSKARASRCSKSLISRGEGVLRKDRQVPPPRRKVRSRSKSLLEKLIRS